MGAGVVLWWCCGGWCGAVVVLVGWVEVCGGADGGSWGFTIHHT